MQSNYFGPRIDPINGEHRFHSGVDIAAPDGMPILAAAGGTVPMAEYTDSGGGVIVIEHRIQGKKVATA